MGKFWLFGAAIDAGYVNLAVIGVLNSAVSLYYYIRVVVFMYLRQETTGSEPTVNPALAVTLGIAIVGTILLGVYPQPLFDFASRSAASLYEAGVAAMLR
jgi:NADH-quinone oxidoreductase subunit N